MTSENPFLKAQPDEQATIVWKNRQYVDKGTYLRVIAALEWQAGKRDFPEYEKWLAK